MPLPSLDEADVLFRTDPAAARLLYQTIFDQSPHLSDKIEALCMLARSHLILDEKEAGRPYIEQAQSLATPALTLAWSRSLSVRGRFEWKDQLLETAAQTFKDMYDFCHAHRLHDRAIDAIHMIALLVPLEEQIVWARRGIEEARTGAPRWLGPLWNNLGATYEELGQLENALDAYTHARTHHHQFGTDSHQAKADWALAHTHRLLKNFDAAQSLLTPLLETFRRLNDEEFQGWTHHELAQLHLAQNQPAAALHHLTQAQSHLQNAGIHSWDPATAQKIDQQLRALLQQSQQQQ